MENNYRIKIACGNSELEIEGDKSFVLEMLERYEKSVLTQVSVPQAAESSVSVAEAQGSTKILSVREFVRRMGFGTSLEATLLQT